MMLSVALNLKNVPCTGNLSLESPSHWQAGSVFSFRCQLIVASLLPRFLMFARYKGMLFQTRRMFSAASVSGTRCCCESADEPETATVGQYHALISPVQKGPRPTIANLLEANKDWAKTMTRKNPEYFSRLAHQQSPKCGLLSRLRRVH